MENLIGQKFGKLSVIDRAESEILSNGHVAIQYHCRCDCGKERDIRATSLKSGHTSSCGCNRKSAMIGVNLEDLTGKKFGKWTVIRKAKSIISKKGKTTTRWHCLCECGTEKDVSAGSLKSGSSLSCGCHKANRFDRNLVGQQYGRWTVLSPGIPRKYSSGRVVRTWSCLCECGTIRDVSENSLICKRSTSCGCYRAEEAKKSAVFEDLTGKRFGSWLVLHRTDDRFYPGGGRSQMWICRCDCGTEKTVASCMLKSGISQSCGCSFAHKLEELTSQYLDFHKFQYIRNYTYDDLRGVGGRRLSYDFAVIAADKVVALIECQGEQHFRPVDYFGGKKKFEQQVEHDIRKADYAASHGLPLFEVMYTDVSYEKVETKLNMLFNCQCFIV